MESLPLSLDNTDSFRLHSYSGLAITSTALPRLVGSACTVWGFVVLS